MKGMVLGIWCDLFSLWCIDSHIDMKVFTSNDILWRSASLTCEMWLLIMEGVIVLIGFIVPVVIVKMYKRRSRIGMFHAQIDWQEKFNDDMQ